MHCFKRQSCYGYTIVELMLSIVISSIILASLYQMFHSQQKNYMTHSESYNMNQNLRSAVYVLTKDLKIAGYNPADSERITPGFVDNFDANIFADIGKSDIDYANEKDRLAFTADKNSDECIDADNDKAAAEPICNEFKTKDPFALTDDGERGEQIAYRLNGNNLERFNSEIYDATNSLEDAWQVIATNIDALNFTFIDKNNNVIDDPTTTANRDQIRHVEMSIIARTENRDYKYNSSKTYTNKQGDELCPTCQNDHYHRQQLSSTVRLRNFNDATKTIKAFRSSYKNPEYIKERMRHNSYRDNDCYCCPIACASCLIRHASLCILY